jgi:hypothetical protein
MALSSLLVLKHGRIAITLEVVTKPCIGNIQLQSNKHSIFELHDQEQLYNQADAGSSRSTG